MSCGRPGCTCGEGHAGRSEEEHDEAHDCRCGDHGRGSQQGECDGHAHKHGEGPPTSLSLEASPES